jgi:ferredoxin/flavodoxin---NADP+ reductase
MNHSNSTRLPTEVTDVTIIGAGPAGLAAAYYVGHREATCRIVESLEQLGGQVAAVYPEKHIFDIAGFPKVNGQEYIDGMVEQALQYEPDVHLGEDVRELERVEHEGEELWRLRTDKGGDYLSRTLIITAGHGAFEPRTLPIPGLEAWRGRGLHYFVTRKAEFDDARCVIVGGGDSALDWTVNLQGTASGPIHLVHRRDRFRGLESSQSEVRRLAELGHARILTPYEVRAIHGVERIEAVDVEHAETGEIERIGCDALILQLGFVSRLGAIAEWGLEVVGKKQVRVDPTTFETALPGVFAAGDVAYYDGKITLITIGLGEAAIAANQCVARVRGVKVQPAYSTE